MPSDRNEPRICAQCGAAITKYRTGPRTENSFCSRACQRAFNGTARKAAPASEEAIQARRDRQREAKRAKRADLIATLPDKVCPVCAGSFSAVPAQRVYCSEKCKDKAYNKKYYAEKVLPARRQRRK